MKNGGITFGIEVDDEDDDDDVEDGDWDWDWDWDDVEDDEVVVGSISAGLICEITVGPDDCSDTVG